jgi:hypothetical protein
MFKRFLTVAVISALGFSSIAHADLVTTDNLIKNQLFESQEHWNITSGEFRIVAKGNVPGYTDAVVSTSYGGHSDGNYMYQRLDLEDEGVNLSLIDDDVVTTNLSFYVGSDYSDRDRSRMFIRFRGADEEIIDSFVTSYYDRNEWIFFQFNDIVVPSSTRFMDAYIHHDLVDGQWSSTGIALPNLTLSVENTPSGSMAMSEHGALQAVDVPIAGIGALALLSLVRLRRK